MYIITIQTDLLDWYDIDHKRMYLISELTQGGRSRDRVRLLR